MVKNGVNRPDRGYDQPFWPVRSTRSGDSNYTLKNEDNGSAAPYYPSDEEYNYISHDDPRSGDSSEATSVILVCATIS